MNRNIRSQLVDRLPNLRSYARSLTRNWVSADDLVQDAAVRILSSIDRYDGSKFASWSGTILRNRFIDGCRRARHYAKSVEPRTNAAAYQKPSQDIVVELDQTLRVIEGLSPAYRQIITMISIEELSYERAAQILDIPIGTVRSRLSRARSALHEAVTAKSALNRPRLPLLADTEINLAA